MRQTSEPTVEEILESIKKVIARDNRAGAAEERRQRAHDGVLAAEPLPAIDPEIAELDDDVLDLAEDDALDEEIDTAADASLLTETAHMSMRESLAALAVLSEPRAQPQIVRSGETSLEGLTRELLRPALADWLDKNLPPLVERLVAAEIARIVGKRG
jgi:cell pole-organizing protein PopZ